MTECSDPPSDSGRLAGDWPGTAGWRGIGPDRFERGIALDDPETLELFLDLLERVARLAGFPADARVRGGEVVVRGERAEGQEPGREPPGLDLILRLTLDRPEP